MKEPYFSEALIKFETAFDTPMRDALASVSLDRQVEVLEAVVKDVEKFAKANNVTICRKTWTEYKEAANWKQLAEKVLSKEKSIFKFFS
jgi:hypothetical protein